MLFSELFDLYYKRHVIPKLENHKNAYYFYKVHGQRWANREADSLTQQEIQLFCDEYGTSRSESAATRAVDMLSAIYNWGMKRGHVKIANPCIGVERFERKSRKRFLLPDEIRRLRLVLAEEKPHYRDLFRLYLSTGVRKSNLLEMRWEQIDLELGIWQIPRTKNGEGHVVALNKVACEILKERPRTSEWVFPGKGGHTHFKEPKRGWARVKQKAGITDAIIHDLRRTHGSCMAIQGEGQYVIGKALGHKDPRSTAVYARLNLQPVREASESAAEKFGW